MPSRRRERPRAADSPTTTAGETARGRLNRLDPSHCLVLIAAWRRWDLFEEDPDEELFTGDKPAAVQDQAPRLRLRTHFT